MPVNIKDLGNILKYSFHDLKRNDPLRIAAATAFFTTFALPAIIIILIQVFGLIYNPEIFSKELFEKLSVTLGFESAKQIHSTLSGFQELASNWYITAGGFIFLMFVATTLFKVIKDSLNQIWDIKLINKARFGKRMKLRAKSMIVIMLAGLLFLGNLVTDAMIILLSDMINDFWPSGRGIIILILKQIISIIIVTVWFAVLFKFLPDARTPWKTAFAGALFTGVLFMLGRYLLGILLPGSNIGNIYGASGSIVLILLFVFYSSFILYYGASFTKQWGEYIKAPLVPREYAMFYSLVELKK